MKPIKYMNLDTDIGSVSANLESGHSVGDSKLATHPYPVVSVIVPVYNEEESIPALLFRLNEAADGQWEILFVDDGSTDSSFRLLSQGNNGTMRLFRHERNLGKGAAIKTALGNARGRVAIVQDADLEYDPMDIPRIVAPICSGSADVVFGSRFLNSEVGGMSLSHILGNRILSKTASILFRTRITDIMTGHKAFRRDTLSPKSLRCAGFDSEIEVTHSLVVSANGRFLEIPIRYSRRVDGEAKISRRDGLRALLRIFKCIVEDKSQRSHDTTELRPKRRSYCQNSILRV
jgi:glycosyltransferase involved in cell wall biosynthesis